MSSNQQTIIDKCIGKYISLLLSNQIQPNQQLQLFIENEKPLSFLQQKFNTLYTQITESNQLEELHQRITELSFIKEIQEIHQIEKEKEKEKEIDIIEKCYCQFVDICTFDEHFKQQFELHCKYQINHPPKSKHLLFHSFFLLYNQILSNEHQNQLFQQKLQYFFSFSEVKIIENKPICISLSFREFFNGFTKKVRVNHNNSLRQFIIKRNACQTDILRIENISFIFQLEPSQWTFNKIETIKDEKDHFKEKECTFLTYHFTREEIRTKSITLPIGKTIVLNDMIPNQVLKGDGYGRYGGYGSILFLPLEEK